MSNFFVFPALSGFRWKFLQQVAGGGKAFTVKSTDFYRQTSIQQSLREAMRTHLVFEAAHALGEVFPLPVCSRIGPQIAIIGEGADEESRFTGHLIDPALRAAA